MRFFRLWLSLISLTMLLIACQSDGISISITDSINGHRHIQVIASGTGIGSSGVWPPQPANMTEVGSLPNFNFALQAVDTSANVRKTSIQNIIMSNRSLLNVLGSNYLLLDVNFSERKSGEQIQEVIFFSYSNNNTVRAWIAADGSVEFNVIAASEYQFPEAAEEITQSISLAKTALINQGYNDASSLNAHAMLTYPEATSGRQFFDVRMLYVTLGKGNGVVPVYAAWVDLSNGLVTKSGPIESY